jgi:hypothetical protein
MHTTFWSDNLKGRAHLEDLGIDGRIFWGGGFTALPLTRQYSVGWWLMYEWWIGKDLEGSHGIIEVLSRQFYGGTEESHERPGQDNLCPGRHNRAPPEYKDLSVTTTPSCSVILILSFHLRLHIPKSLFTYSDQILYVFFLSVLYALRAGPTYIWA